MSALFDITHDAGSIDAADPVEWDAWRELIGPPPLLWLKAMPQWRGSRWPNLASRVNRGGLDGALLNGPTWSAQTHRGGSGSLQFDGTNDYVQTSASVKNNADFTFACWFKTNSTSTANPQLLVYEGQTAGNGFGAHPEVHLALAEINSGGGTIGGSLGFYGSTTIPPSTLQAAVAFTDTTAWHHAVSVARGIGTTASSCDVFLDGVLVASDAHTVALDRSSQDTNIRIGAPGNVTRCFSGLLDDALVFNRALSENQVLALYRASLSGYPGSLRRTPGRSYFWVGAGGGGGGRTTKNTRAFPLGVNVGMGFQNCNI